MRHWKSGSIVNLSIIGAVALIFLYRFLNMENSVTEISYSKNDPAAALVSGQPQPGSEQNQHQAAPPGPAESVENPLINGGIAGSIEQQPFDITSNFNSRSLYYVARHLVITRYGEFIRDLPLSSAEKQAVRKLMMKVQAYNSALGQRLRTGEISQIEYSNQRLLMESELAELLGPDSVEKYKEAEAQAGNQFREQMGNSRNRIVENNLQRISGLTNENRELFLTKLVEANGGVSEQNFYEDSVLYSVRNELAELFDSDQLEVLDIYIESEQVRRAQIEAMSQGIEDTDGHSSRFLVNARANINSTYGGFIRYLPLSPSEKQEVRATMVRVQANNADLTEAISSGQASAAEFSGNYLRMGNELAKVLGESELKTFLEFEEKRIEELRQTSVVLQQRMIDDNMQRISGLTDSNRRLFTDALAAIEPQPGAAGHYRPETIQRARDQIANSLDSDQLEVIDIYLAESMGFQQRVEEQRQRRQNN